MRKIPNSELNRLSVEEFQDAKKNPIVVVLDNVRSMQNVGSVFRTCDAFLIEKMYLCGITATPPHRDITRSALGATETVDWEHVPETLVLVKQLQAEGYRVYAIEQVESAISLEHFEWNGSDKIALIFGHEVNGVDQEVVASCDGYIEIPQFGSKHSFNISVSAGIVLWQCIGPNIN